MRPVEGGQEEVAEGVPGEAAAVREAVLEEAGEQVFVVGQRGDAVADVARRQHPEFPAQHARGAAVVGHGDDAEQVGEAARVASERLEPAQDAGEAGAAPDDGDGPARDGRRQVGVLPALAEGGEVRVVEGMDAVLPVQLDRPLQSLGGLVQALLQGVDRRLEVGEALVLADRPPFLASASARS